MKQRYSKPLDTYEEELEKFLNKGIFKQPRNQKKILREHREAAKNYLARKSITIRVRDEDIQAVKHKAKKASMPYQTLLNLLIGQFAKGKIKLAI